MEEQYLCLVTLWINNRGEQRLLVEGSLVKFLPGEAALLIALGYLAEPEPPTRKGKVATPETPEEKVEETETR